MYFLVQAQNNFTNRWKVGVSGKMRDGISALTLNFWEKLRTKELFQQRSTLKGKNEKVVEIRIREAKSPIFCLTIVIHKKGILWGVESKKMI